MPTLRTDPRFLGHPAHSLVTIRTVAMAYDLKAENWKVAGVLYDHMNATKFIA
jgi:hypothetical protein